MNKTKVVLTSQHRKAVAYIKCLTGLSLPLVEFVALLVQHPAERQALETRGADDERVQDMLADMIATHLTGQGWPNDKDHRELALFLDQLHLGATRRGYTVEKSAAVSFA